MVGCPQDRRFEPVRMNVGKIGSRINAFGVCLFDRGQQGIFQSFTKAGFATAVWSVEQDNALLQIEGLGSAETPKWPNGQMSQTSPWPSTVVNHRLDVWRSVRCLSQRHAGVAYQMDGSLVVLAGGLSQFGKVRQHEIGQASHVWDGLDFWLVQPDYKPLKVLLGRRHLPPGICVASSSPATQCFESEEYILRASALDSTQPRKKWLRSSTIKTSSHTRSQRFKTQ